MQYKNSRITILKDLGFIFNSKGDYICPDTVKGSELIRFLEKPNYTKSCTLNKTTKHLDKLVLPENIIEHKEYLKTISTDQSNVSVLVRLQTGILIDILETLISLKEKIK